ncbi:unnamed protein product, partial [Didymodactylos carnosus]
NALPILLLLLLILLPQNDERTLYDDNDADFNLIAGINGTNDDKDDDVRSELPLTVVFNVLFNSIYRVLLDFGLLSIDVADAAQFMLPILND